ncbi:probable disease resistance protein At4g27220 isoform X2 [Prosopis cineraria]|uniref:probable disease resistance protein At4g27220 isoform X2 n=1 Tax=Prosopis cineraria TaxID=364024 RepID=UPI00240EB265|nr:probable disease resistance protein At4g27220 isoform X2 [Prosopis cineraria]
MEVVGCVSSITGLCISCLHEVIGKKYKHLRTAKRSSQKLNNLMEKLEAHKKDVEHEVNKLWYLKGAESTNVCNLWLEQAEQLKREVSNLIGENGLLRPDKGCCFICSRIKLGELIEKKIVDTNELLENVPHSDDSVVNFVTKRGVLLSATPMMEYETHEQIFMKIWGFLFDEHARRIGIFGAGGAGKTTIMSEVNNRLLINSTEFNCIIWVEASKDLQKLQQDIAVKLDLTFQEADDERTRASKLLEAFNRRKRFTLILDEVWEPFNIESIGIPVPTVENGCKLVIITRDVRVCRVMETDKDVEVKVLSKEEAWDLFKDKAGEQVLSNPNIQSIAMDVAKECGGLPLAIVAVGRALRNTTNIREWENALAELRTSNTGIYTIDEMVCSRLKLSYSTLKDDTRRSCFLYCSLYPKGHLIDENELINYWVWEDLLEGQSMFVMKRKGQMIIDELISGCLLELKIENGVRFVKLHDMVRDMAITIMSTKPRCIVNAGMGQVKPAMPQEWREDIQWVSLMRNDVKSIDFSPMCPRITSLLLQYNSLENLSGPFFNNMHWLKVLNLSYTGIHVLPVSLSNLYNLHALLLSHCWNLVEVPSLERLTKLKHLDFSFSRGLTKLPLGMEQLTDLRHLDFSFTSVQNLPTGLISKFTLLEGLLMLGSHMIGVSSKRAERTLYPVTVEEIISCHNLSLLHMQFFDLEDYQKFAKFLKSSQLKELKLVVGLHNPEFSEKTGLAIGGGNRRVSEAEITALIPLDVEELIICDIFGMECLSLYLLDAMYLKRCRLDGCPDIKCIVESKENNLSLLERLNLRHLPKLRMICGKVVRPRTLMNLKSIHVASCWSLKCLFPRQLMDELKSLEEIAIDRCFEMEEIIEGERNANAENSSHAAKVILPKLQRLKLDKLPTLKSIYKGDIECNSLRTIEVEDCDALNKLPPGLFGAEAGQQISPSATLQQITCTYTWWQSLQWDQPEAKILLQPYLVNYFNRDKILSPSTSYTAVSSSYTAFSGS